MVHFISFHINGAKRSGRAKVFAGTAADALVFVHGWHLHRTVRTFVVNHLDGSRRAMSCAVAATDTVSQDDAIFLNPHGMTDMDGGLFLACDGFDGTSRTHLAASCAFGTAVAALKRHHGLHEVHQVSGGTQHVVGATGDTELTGRAMPLHVAC